MGRIIPYMKWKIKFMFETTNQFLSCPYHPGIFSMIFPHHSIAGLPISGAYKKSQTSAEGQAIWDLMIWEMEFNGIEQKLGKSSCGKGFMGFNGV